MTDNLPVEFDFLKPEEQDQLVNWCLTLNKIKTVNTSCTSYGLKHIFENSKDGFYVTNGMFKGAMLKAGFTVKDENALNWTFNVSKKSVSEKRNEQVR